MSNSLRRPLQEITRLPETPERDGNDEPNSDDLIRTSDVGYLSPERSSIYTSNPIVIVGSYDKPITLGRGGASTIKIGRRNRQISRTHVSIQYNSEQDRFELIVIGLNGATVDDVPYRQHERALLDDNSFVDVLGDHVIFKQPPPPLRFDKEMAEKMTTNPRNLFDDELEQPPKKRQYNEIEHKKQDERHERDDNELLNDSMPSANEDHECSARKEVSQTEKIQTCEKQDDQEKDAHEMQSMEDDEDQTGDSVEVDQDYSEIIIDALVFSRKSSMPVSDICSRIMSSNPVYKAQSCEMWIERIQRVLKDKPFFGEIVRKGKTADGSPKENLYYYNGDLDPVEWRRATYTQVGRSARKCTLQDKQYFWKIPPKLGRNRSSYIPPPAKAYTPSSPSSSKRTKINKEQEDTKSTEFTEE
ncbi:hypothetical protein DFQ28_002086 [Apophysomyces sp. BC1034]|nr:hypothetical protein DFQ30_002494 [Apophysomyces sp. BC1015]KAG0179868.1 hypothetical protein DFQ29_001521 [Apophysomyces sp. BC1021]KAG0190417.1 hypothetical protein DFQ28_002086 [Apophysomyces sp. BC1034]